MFHLLLMMLLGLQMTGVLGVFFFKARRNLGVDESLVCGFCGYREKFEIEVN